MATNQHILLTIDVEDWFQVENFKPWIPFETWDQRELRVEHNVHRLLDLLDSVEATGGLGGWQAGKLGSEKAKSQEAQNSINPINKLSNGQRTTDNLSNGIHFNDSASEFHRDGNNEAAKLQPHSLPASQLQPIGFEPPSLPASQLPGLRPPKATFFVLGWLAPKLPNLVREIHSRGHEVASHGVNHQRCDQLSFEELKRDLSDSKKHLEDILGGPVTGYRAPSFSINEHVIRATEDAGYLYGSSYNSFNMHERYGQIDLSANGKKGIAHKISDNFFELPLSNLKLLGQNLPWSGGAYFRIIPYGLFKKGVQSILKSEGAYVFYMHPWEIDPLQPRVEKAYFNRKFRHYSNLSHTYPKLRRLIESFQQHQFVTCSDYIHRVTRTNNDHQQTINKAQPSTNYRLLATD